MVAEYFDCSKTEFLLRDFMLYLPFPPHNTWAGGFLGKMPIFARREEAFPTELSGPVANVPFLLMGVAL